MRRLISSALVLVAALAALADSPPPPPSTREFYSPNRQFVALSEPATNTITTYRVGPGGTFSKLWSMQGWEYNAWLADDGEHFVASYHGMNLIPRNFERDMTMLRFYENGKLFKMIGLDEVVQDQANLMETASHYFWGYFLGRDEKGRVVVATVDGNELFYDATTGDLLEKRALKDGDSLDSEMMRLAEKEPDATLLRIPSYPGSKRGEYYCSLQLPPGSFVVEEEGQDPLLPYGAGRPRQDDSGQVYAIFVSGISPGPAVGVYIGNHPDFPLDPVDGSEITDLDICAHDLQPYEVDLRKTGNSASEIKIRSWWKDGKTVHRELLVSIQNPNKRPSCVHVWITSSVPEGQRQLVEKVLFSLQVRQYPP